MRSLIFVPAYDKKYLEKSLKLSADILILDLEDSVPQSFKSEARQNLQMFLNSEDLSGKRVWVRVNPLFPGEELEEDLRFVAHKRVEAFMLPKARTPEDISSFLKVIEEAEAQQGFEPSTFKICPLIETSLAVLRSYDIAMASDRVIALALGGEDYLTDLDGLHKEHGMSLLTPRSLMVVAARAAGVTPIDTPYLDVHNDAGLRRELELARELGFGGSLLIHPNHVPIANEIFSPSQAEYQEALAIIQELEMSKKNGLEVALYEGKLIGPPMKARALRVIEKVKSLRIL
jgi:citrate lyase subunit beta/citryl-CoA lyase